MKEQLQTVMDTIVMPLVASLGGVAGILTMITAIAKIITSVKTNNRALTVAEGTKTEVTGLLGTLLTEFQRELEKRLNCKFEVDFSAKLSDTVGALQTEILTLSEQQREALNALKTLMTDIALMYTTSRNMTEEERVTLLEHIAAVNALVIAPKEPEKEKDVVVIEYKPETAQESAKPEPAQKPSAVLRGI